MNFEMVTYDVVDFTRIMRFFKTFVVIIIKQYFKITCLDYFIFHASKKTLDNNKKDSVKSGFTRSVIIIELYACSRSQ